MPGEEVPHWLGKLPHAPEFRPTETEFADPIAYISKIEKEASAYGICKIIPPFPRPSKKYVFSNLNRSLKKSPELGADAGEAKLCPSDSEREVRAVFTTRQQELGNAEKKGKVGIQLTQPIVNKQVWQSGELYTLDQFESKAKAFAKSTLGMVKDVSPLVVEAMFWRAALEKPIYVEYANDVPGSGFGEPSGNGSFQYFLKRRRKRVFRRANESTYKKYVVNGVKESDTDYRENGDCCGTSGALCEVKTTVGSPSISTDRNTKSSQQDKSNYVADMEGTSGWKLSNCPWNLQVIARSPGSLTRFMPDDIPGVTSPMVYIGMLFSWFAWHIEDHELHSLNFLHTGSPKTWYCVPGDQAFAFEEVIRTQAYGENVDRLAALTMLGEKTTLLSPETIVASEIPCCRLVQNPGEFVVTFPRAYHVGFSHGFNCGEAANFGTPQWLKVAKEAAVRRAAMNFLPMLSHQQLLYLLTMSFVSRVPRALLVGARSSRLRDRIKEQRELSVKKAFIEDVVNENKLLSLLCGAQLAYRAVLWDPESLSSLSKDPSSSSKMEDNAVSVEESGNSCHLLSNHNLLAEMSLYMETAIDQYVDDDGFLSDFQVDYGTVACVACGILGFPFMTVVQPRPSGQNKSAAQKTCQDDSSDHSIPALSRPEVSAPMKFGKEWNASDKFFRPRVFCLEHAIQVNDLLESKGGAEVLVICHSDFQKIKNHAAAVADELGSKYNYDMVPLDNASVEDLNLIDRAIDEDKDENAEDWSGILGINLHHCIKMRKNSSSKHVDHALKLFDLPSNVKTSPKLVSSSLSHLKWQHTRFRSKIEIHIDHKPSSKLGSSRIKRQKKIIQYKRRKSKRKSFASKPIINTSENSAVISNDIDESGICLSEHNISVDLNDSTASVPLSTLIQVSKVAASPPVDVMCSVISDKKLKKSCSVLGACVSTGENAIVADSKIHTTGNEGEITSIYAMENSRSSYSAVRVGGPCTFENNQVNRGSSTSLEDSIECESVVQVDNRIVSVSMVRDIVADGSPSAASLESETIHAVIATSDRDSDGSLPLSLSQMCESEDPSTLLQHVSGSREEYVVGENAQLLKKASEVISAPCIEDEPSCCTITNLNQAPHGPPDNLKPPSGRKSRKRNRELEQLGDEKCEGGDFIKSPCEGLRPRSNISSTCYVTDPGLSDDEEPAIVEKRSRRIGDYASAPRLTKTVKQNSKGQHSCHLDGCTSSFKTKSDLLLHQQNQCHIQGCRKTFTCHRYLIVHQRVHADDRPLKCSWKGCNMSFKWAWARTEHLRVHTGERPYKCKAVGCGQSFRFISDFSRHRRKTGHVVDQKV